MKNIYIVGFMGTGKTSTAKELAKRLGREFIDMDDSIQGKEGLAINGIFKEKGEPYFRKLEKDLVRELSCRENLVVSCGGGVIVDEENLSNLKKSGTVICFKSDVDVILRRTKDNSERPLLNVDNPRKQISELLKKREPFYSQSDHTIDTTHLSIAETVDKIIKIIK